jgi:NitT/TauT family transport system ATP-binding protein
MILSLAIETMSQSIAIRGISKDFGALRALQDVSMYIESGQFIAVVGKSGCGKSTLLRLIAGLKQPTNGSIEIGGNVVTGPADSVGFVFQSPALLPWRTVQGNILLQLEIRKLVRPDSDAEISRLLSLSGLKGFDKHHPYELSGGMQQRVALCRALIHNPTLLLMDEPFGALDAMTREQLNVEIQRIWMETGKTIILVTHSIAEAVFLADRVVVMSSSPGEVLEVVDVGVSRPRSFSGLDDPEFHSAAKRIRQLMDTEASTK